MRIALFAVLLCAIGCVSAYDETYEQETQRLEQEEQAYQAEAEAAHAEAEAALAEARRYAAVVYFDVNSAVIQEDGYRELLWFVQQMQPHPDVIIQVQGFADSTGTESLNQALSEQRAESVVRYLGSEGIDPSRIRTQGFASEFAARPNVTAEGRQRNRRVEVTVR
jgi:outer membrane protein OmpA-like peptidoglycan-associated protein